MRSINSGRSCSFCGSYNTFVYRNPFHIRNTIICGYCYAIENLSFSSDDENFKINDLHLNYLNEFVKKTLDKNIFKDVLIFDNFLSEKHVNFGDGINSYFIRNYDSIVNINNILGYCGKLKSVLVPNLNLLHFEKFYEKIKDLLADKFVITLAFHRERYYSGMTNIDYHYIYNPLCIERILQLTPDFVQEDFFYKDNYFIINISRHEPARYEIKELESLTNKFIEEDSNPKYIKTF